MAWQARPPGRPPRAPLRVQHVYKNIYMHTQASLGLCFIAQGDSVGGFTIWGEGGPVRTAWAGSSRSGWLAGWASEGEKRNNLIQWGFAPRHLYLFLPRPGMPAAYGADTLAPPPPRDCLQVSLFVGGFPRVW